MNPSLHTPPRGLSAETIRVIVRIVLFIGIAWLGLIVFPFVFGQFTRAPLVIAVMTTFATGAVANGVLSLAYDEGKIASVGLTWARLSQRELLLGAGMGAGAAAAVVIFAIVTRMASFARIPDAQASPGGLIVVAVLLVFGAVGEELIFHGYAFRLLMRSAGDFAAILPSAVLFGLVHTGNSYVTLWGIVNTIAWGILLGYATARTRALWLAIGMHFGWNVMQPLFGERLSGFTIGLTGFELRWSAGESLSGGAYGIEGGALTTVVVIALFFVIRRAFAEPSGDAVVRP